MLYLDKEITMTKIIIYPQDNKSISVVYPSGELDINEVARKDIPANKPYKIIDDSLLPTEYNEFFNAWEADFTEYDGISIGADAWFEEQRIKEQK